MLSSAHQPAPQRVALVHDFRLDLGGAARGFVEPCEIWSDADIFTAVYDEDGTEGRFSGYFWSRGREELIDAVLSFDEAGVDPQACVRNAARFDKHSFSRGMHAEVDAAVAADSHPPASDRQPLASTRLFRRAAREGHR